MGAGVSMQGDTSKYALSAEVILAVVKGNLEMVRAALQYVNAQDDRGRTILHYAAEHGMLEICHWLLETFRGQVLIDKHADAPSKITPLMLACWRGHATCVDLLLRYGANPNNAVDTDGNTPLTAALHRGRWTAFGDEISGEMHFKGPLYRCSVTKDVENHNNFNMSEETFKRVFDNFPARADFFRYEFPGDTNPRRVPFGEDLGRALLSNDDYYERFKDLDTELVTSVFAIIGAEQNISERALQKMRSSKSKAYNTFFSLTGRRSMRRNSLDERAILQLNVYERRLMDSRPLHTRLKDKRSSMVTKLSQEYSEIETDYFEMILTNESSFGKVMASIDKRIKIVERASAKQQKSKVDAAMARAAKETVEAAELQEVSVCIQDISSSMAQIGTRSNQEMSRMLRGRGQAIALGLVDYVTEIDKLKYMLKLNLFQALNAYKSDAHDCIAGQGKKILGLEKHSKVPKRLRNSMQRITERLVKEGETELEEIVSQLLSLFDERGSLQDAVNKHRTKELRSAGATISQQTRQLHIDGKKMEMDLANKTKEMNQGMEKLSNYISTKFLGYRQDVRKLHELCATQLNMAWLTESLIAIAKCHLEAKSFCAELRSRDHADPERIDEFEKRIFRLEKDMEVFHLALDYEDQFKFTTTSEREAHSDYFEKKQKTLKIELGILELESERQRASRKIENLEDSATSVQHDRNGIKNEIEELGTTLRRLKSDVTRNPDHPEREKKASEIGMLTEQIHDLKEQLEFGYSIVRDTERRRRQLDGEMSAIKGKIELKTLQKELILREPVNDAGSQRNLRLSMEAVAMNRDIKMFMNAKERSQLSDLTTHSPIPIDDNYYQIIQKLCLHDASCNVYVHTYGYNSIILALAWEKRAVTLLDYMTSFGNLNIGVMQLGKPYKSLIKTAIQWKQFEGARWLESNRPVDDTGNYVDGAHEQLGIALANTNFRDWFRKEQYELGGMEGSKLMLKLTEDVDNRVDNLDQRSVSQGSDNNIYKTWYSQSHFATPLAKKRDK